MDRFTANIVLILLFSGCQILGPEDLNSASDLDQITLVPIGDSNTIEKDPFEIVSSSIEGDVLLLTLSYGGGCEDHEFAFYSEGPVMESFPPGAMIRVYHDSKNDHCRALIRQTFEIDLRPLRANETDQVVIFLLHFDQDETSRLRYRY
ncbi:MAG: hypothetical protein BMS9Abin05_2569 [Rhodothermia bacterium]|nr:MAG: hypothetical protein BMS9Abin05_2569 [Rhodothermia bacterium]